MLWLLHGLSVGGMIKSFIRSSFYRRQRSFVMGCVTNCLLESNGATEQ
jgi:hypothetical protein